MCGRFYIEIDERELQDIVNAVKKNIQENPEQLTIKFSGEIFPTETVPVQTGSGRYLAMKWGFIAYNGRPVINARSETALEKPMFKQPMLERRCLVPASGYYEWLKEGNKKSKYQLFIPGSLLYFAGCWRQEKERGANTFMILTQPAAESIAFIHERMPVIIPHNQRDAWLNGSPDVMHDAVAELSYRRVS